MTAGIMPLCVLASWDAITTRVRGFMAMLLIMETAMVGVFVALDFVLFYVFWEAMLIPMYLLIGVWGGPNLRGHRFFLYTLGAYSYWSLSSSCTFGGTFRPRLRGHLLRCKRGSSWRSSPPSP
jgi:NADH:ubiquinone oxidoreductase subunit 4 (subunit M)